MNYTPKIKFDDIRRLPNLNDEDPIFENKNYDICKENDENIREKYKISDYYVRYLRLS
ncbi:hypothetical protein IJX73_01995 [bacterium]|nr:hypothetical protein [bacterium]MBQ9149681.1 hypothetical protein [bacterium]